MDALCPSVASDKLCAKVRCHGGPSVSLISLKTKEKNNNAIQASLFFQGLHISTVAHINLLFVQGVCVCLPARGCGLCAHVRTQERARLKDSRETA